MGTLLRNRRLAFAGFWTLALAGCNAMMGMEEPETRERPDSAVDAPAQGGAGGEGGTPDAAAGMGGQAGDAAPESSAEGGKAGSSGDAAVDSPQDAAPESATEASAEAEAGDWDAAPDVVTDTVSEPPDDATQDAVSEPPPEAAQDVTTEPPPDATEDVTEAGVCTTGSKQCVGGVPQHCQSGNWVDQTLCQAQACVDGECVGNCSPNTLRCDGQQPQTCSVNGVWLNDAGCVNQACVDGSCIGLCTPGHKRCEGAMPQQCDASGQWQDGTACGGATPLCSGGYCLPDTVGQSCDGLANDCGPAKNESCCSSAIVPGGTYRRGHVPTNPAQLSNFRLDTFEITVGRFRKFVEAYPASKPAAGAGKNENNPLDPGWDSAWDASLPADAAALKAGIKYGSLATWTDTPGTNETRPITSITWFEAQAFCIWDGGRLPTEAEWTYAAAGGAEQRIYPWSDPWVSTAIDCSHASYNCCGDGVNGCTIADLMPVGSKQPLGAAKWGHAEMAGNAFEWVIDWSAQDTNPCVNCAVLDFGEHRLSKGGGASNDGGYALTSTRTPVNPGWRADTRGARCARSAGGECVPGTVRCNGQAPETCDAYGAWQTAPSCLNSACSQGACTGVCEPGQKRCNGTTTQECSASGAWADVITCSGATPQCSGGACVTAAGDGASCNGLPAICGPNRDKSCCASALVPGGTYNRSNDDLYPATVSPFRLDTYEVTVGRFRRFVEAYPGSIPAAGAGKNPNNGADQGWNSGWNAQLPADQTTLRGSLKCDQPNYTWTNTPGANENRPIGCATWYEAFAFCIWDGGRLPTELEWDFAAAGGTEQRVYPWSSPPDSAVIDAAYASYGGLGDSYWESTLTDLLPVGSRPLGNGRWGHADLGGNAWEWLRDYYVTPYPSGTCTDCCSLAQTDVASIRGGACYTTADILRNDHRYADHHWDRYASFGFRCARNP